MKICVTGLGLISAAGKNAQETLATLESGRRNAGPVSLFTSEIQSPVFEVKNFSRNYLSPKLRTQNLCLAALEDAVENAGLKGKLQGKRVGIALGTTVGSILNDVEFYREFREKGSASMEMVNLYLQGNIAACSHAFLKTEGLSLTVVNACASGADAIGAAMSWLRAGLCDVALAGGADEMNRVPLCGFHSLGILSDSLCLPFDRDRKGLNLGEGAGVLVLEEETAAKKRGGKIRAITRGYGTSNDAYHLTSPDPEGQGLERSISSALRDAGLIASDISFINAHGTATRENDFVEGMVLHRLFQGRVPFISTKGHTGHTLGAAGALEAGFTILALENGWIPASAGFQNQDPDIATVPASEKTPIQGRFGLSTSLGFGGCDAALIFERADKESLS